MQASEDVYMGKFWLPMRGEESAVSGMLMLHDRGATLHLPEVLSEEELDDATIFGRLQGSYEYATLRNCYGSWTRGIAHVMAGIPEPAVPAHTDTPVRADPRREGRGVRRPVRHIAPARPGRADWHATSPVPE